MYRRRLTRASLRLEKKPSIAALSRTRGVARPAPLLCVPGHHFQRQQSQRVGVTGSGEADGGRGRGQGSRVAAEFAATRRRRTGISGTDGRARRAVRRALFPRHGAVLRPGGRVDDCRLRRPLEAAPARPGPAVAGGPRPRLRDGARDLCDPRPVPRRARRRGRRDRGLPDRRPRQAPGARRGCRLAPGRRRRDPGGGLGAVRRDCVLLPAEVRGPGTPLRQRPPRAPTGRGHRPA